ATQRDVWRLIAHLVGVPHADDLTQETFLRSLRSLPSFEGRSSARTWLLSIARRAAIDHLRAQRVQPALVFDEPSDVADPGAGFEEIVAVNLMLAALPTDRREALLLTQVLGLSYAEAATICDCPVGTIRSRVARGREDLIQARGEDAVGAG
ncbi:MAG: sigma-70 family RNA polymerase sigma factor, partial [Actinomycetota bacterium]|nr:sigma-70 family RNA polymerase sigma factor [Actinomycetota bacterium]